MSTIQMSHVDLEQGNHRRSVAASEVSADESVCFSDAEDGSCYSHFYSTNGGSYDDYSFGCVSDSEVRSVPDSGRASSVTDCSVEVETESGVPEIKVHLDKIERNCRICHLGLDSDCHEEESGILIELGCSCKNDLAVAHRHCAETWFKMKGNRTCEICQSIARNVYGGNEELTERSSVNNIAHPAAATTTASTPSPLAETRRFWHGHRFLNFLLACMVFAFVISWLFHFNVPSS